MKFAIIVLLLSVAIRASSTMVWNPVAEALDASALFTVDIESISARGGVVSFTSSNQIKRGYRLMDWRVNCKEKKADIMLIKKYNIADIEVEKTVGPMAVTPIIPGTVAAHIVAAVCKSANI